MEVWKFINYSNISPILALSLTAKRWGLDPFAGNVVAISGYWHNLQASNNSVQLASTLPYQCDDNPSSYLDSYVHNHQTYYSEGNTRNITANSSICDKISRNQPCDTNCIVLIEGVGRSTTGPANSNIVGLIHGISFIISSLAAAFITMGFLDGLKKRQKNTKALPIIEKSYNRPQQPLTNPNLEEEYHAARDVAYCAQLMRQMYALDLSIWAMEDCAAAEIPQREELKDQANALFEEIHNIVQAWQKEAQIQNGGTWTPEEKILVGEISTAVSRYSPERYILETRAVAKKR